MAVNDCDLGRLVSLPANLPVRGTVTSVLSLLLRHEHPELGVAIPARARTVIHAGVRVDPDFYIWIPGLHVPCRSIFFLGGRGRTFCGWRRLAIRSTRLATSRPISCLNRRTFPYVLTALRIPVPTSARTVVDAAAVLTQTVTSFCVFPCPACTAGLTTYVVRSARRSIASSARMASLVRLISAALPAHFAVETTRLGRDGRQK